MFSLLKPSLAPTQLILRILLLLCLLSGLVLAFLFLQVSSVRADTIVGGLISEDTTWSEENSPYIVATGSITVAHGAKLTIEPGVTVRFNPGLKLWVDGTLVARGTEANPVVFTSNYPNPSPGNWGNIHFLETAVPTVIDENGNYISGSILQHCVVEYAGYGWLNAIYSYLNTLMVDNCRIENNNGSGILIVSDSGTSSRVTNNILRNNNAPGQGGGVLLYYGVIQGNTISNNSAGGGADGGGIYALQADIINNVVTGNSTKGTSGTEGSGIYLVSEGSGELVVRGNLVQGNDTVTNGGGIFIRSGSAQTEITVQENAVIENSASGSGGGIYLAGTKSSITLEDNYIWGNNANSDDPSVKEKSGGGIYCKEGNHVIRNNIVMNNFAQEQGGGVFTDKCPLEGNQILYNTAVITGGGVVSSGDVLSNTISANTLNGVYASGSGLYLQGSGSCLYNSITDNTSLSTTLTGGLHIDGTPEVHFNNLYANFPYDVVVESSDDISGTFNYWGTITETEIQDHIYDFYDEDNRGEFIYSNFQTEPIVETPLLPPTGLTAILIDNHIELDWDPDPNVSEDWGYKVYYDTDGLYPPFDGTGLIEGDSPVDVGDQISYTLSGILAYTDYYIGVTVYDDMGHESDYALAAVFQEGALLPSPPTELTATLIGDQIVLEWIADPNFAEGWGHLVYYDTDSQWSPYEGTGLVEGNSPIDVGEETSFILSGIDAYQDYYLAVTTYDNLGNVSNYAVVAVMQDDPIPLIYLPMVSR